MVKTIILKNFNKYKVISFSLSYKKKMLLV